MENETQASQPTQPELSITDLQNLRAIVETAARRGAFAAGEMTAVGTVFDKLSAFLSSIAPAPASAAAADQTPAT